VHVFLIRHPRPRVEAGICYGRLDLDTDDAEPVASRLRSLLPAATPLISSPLLRARRLAELLHEQPTYDDRLREIDFGNWEGQRWADIDRAAIDAWAADVLHFAPPGGESVAMLQARAIACATALSGERCALLTHAGVMRALLGHWLRLPVGEWSQLAFDFGSLTLLEVEGERAVLRYMNRVSLSR
jgi:alpha-ribazole phosphatase